MQREDDLPVPEDTPGAGAEAGSGEPGGHLGIERHHEHGRRKNNRAENSHQPTRRRERKSSGSRHRVQPRNFFPRTPPFTTLSTSNAISLQPKRTAPFALRR
jgi:transposase-like protein